MNAREEMFLGPWAHLWAVTLATAQAYLKRVSAYLIELVRWPLGPLFSFATWRVTYEVSGRSHVDGATASGFLLIGIFGLITWTSTVWASGYAIMYERHEGTSGALFLSPASRAAVVAGYGLGSFLWFLPSVAAVTLLGVVTGARLDVADPLALVASAAALLASSLAVGFALSGLFVLSRQGNLVANVVQQPIYLLAGFILPLAALPGPLRLLSDALPASHAVAALRSSALAGANLGAVGEQVLLALGVSLLYWLGGLFFLGRVERVAKRTGRLDLY
jgi:ABC-2 type transport system permease protein